VRLPAGRVHNLPQGSATLALEQAEDLSLLAAAAGASPDLGCALPPSLGRLR